MVTPLTPDDPAALGGLRLSGRLGEGGQGVVYLAHTASGEAVAIKLLSAGDRQTRARLARELDALEGIASFCTARVLDVSTEGARPFVVSEYVDGPSLADRVRERGPLRGGDLERLAVGTATALTAIHAAGIVHRDFKPANVLLGPDGPRVVDFGIARAEGAATLTSGLIGTPAYLAPEQIAGSPASPASDVFSWAASILYAATGTSPFGADTVPAVLHRVLHAEPDLSPLPPRLRGLIGSCLLKDPARRPSAQQLMMSLVDPNAAPRPPLPGPPGPAPAPQGPAPARQGPAPAPPQGHFPGAGGTTGPRRPDAPTAGTRRTRTRGVLVGVVAAAVALAAGTVVVLTLDRAPAMKAGDRSASAAPPATGSRSGPPTPARSSPAETGTQTGTLPATETGTETPAGAGPKIPAAFEGDWSGRTTSTNPMDDGAENTVKLKPGESTAAWSEENAEAKCTGTITLTKAEPALLTFSLGANEGGCIAGTITLALRGDALTYTWRDVPGFGLVTETGTLKKK
ncbi:serine/threonine-protein kinase [Nonomuraea sp. NPDC002799]